MASVKDLGGGKYRVYLCRTRPDGTLERPSKVIHAKSSADAKKQANALEVDFRRAPMEIDTPAQTVVHTLIDVVEKWRKIEAPGLARKTVERYEGMLNQFIIPAFGDRNIEEIKVLDIKEYLAALGVDGVRKDGRPGGYSQKTVKAHFMLIQRLFTCAFSWEWVQANPCSRVETPRVDKHEASYMDPAQIQAMLDALDKMCTDTVNSFSQSIKYFRMGMFEAKERQLIRVFNDYMHQTYAWLALTTGGRRSELTGLNWTDFDFEAEQVTIRRTLHYTPTNGIYEVNKLKNGAATKPTPLPHAMIVKLQQYREVQKKLIDSMGWPYHDRVFISTRGSKVTTPGGDIMPDVISKWFTTFLQKYGLDKVTLHGLRHSCISYLLNSGVAVEVVASIAGHNPSVTREIYEHIYPEAKREGIDKFDGILEGRV